MAWKIELAAEADRELSKLDSQHCRRLLKFLRERLAKLHDPRSIGEALRVQFLPGRGHYFEGIFSHADDYPSVAWLGIAHRECPFPCGAILKSARPKNLLIARRIFSGRF